MAKHRMWSACGCTPRFREVHQLLATRLPIKPSQAPRTEALSRIIAQGRPSSCWLKGPPAGRAHRQLPAHPARDGVSPPTEGWALAASFDPAVIRYPAGRSFGGARRQLRAHLDRVLLYVDNPYPRPGTTSPLQPRSTSSRGRGTEQLLRPDRRGISPQGCSGGAPAREGRPTRITTYFTLFRPRHCQPRRVQATMWTSRRPERGRKLDSARARSCAPSSPTWRHRRAARRYGHSPARMPAVVPSHEQAVLTRGCLVPA